MDFYLKDIPRLLQRTKELIYSLSLFYKKENAFFAQKIEHLNQLANFCCNIFNSISYICLNFLNNENQAIILNIIQILPSFIDDIWNNLNDEKLANANLFAETIAISRSKLLQSSLNLLIVYYNSDFVTDKRRLQMIFDNLNKKEFIVRLDTEINLERELSKFFSKKICSENQLDISIKEINNAYEEKRKSIKNTLKRQRILNFIGFPKEKYIADQLQELCEIIPDLSNQQIHLCLRHFGYDIEKTTETLFQREQLPLNLRILLRVKDNLEEDQYIPRQSLFSDEKIDLSDEIYFDENNFKKTIKEIENLNELLKSDEKIVHIDGKFFEPKSSQKDPSEKKRIILSAVSIKLAKMFEEEDEENIFNDDYNDEYDDTYENIQECKGVDIATFTVDEDFELATNIQERKK